MNDNIIEILKEIFLLASKSFLATEYSRSYLSSSKMQIRLYCSVHNLFNVSKNQKKNYFHVTTCFIKMRFASGFWCLSACPLLSIFFVKYVLYAKFVETIFNKNQSLQNFMCAKKAICFFFSKRNKNWALKNKLVILILFFIRQIKITN